MGNSYPKFLPTAFKNLYEKLSDEDKKIVQQFIKDYQFVFFSFKFLGK